MGYAKLRKREYENNMGGNWGEEVLRNLYHFVKRPVPVYQLLVYPLIGQFFNVRKRNRDNVNGWSRVNVKVEPRTTFAFTRGLSYIASISFTYVNFTSTARKNYATVEIHLKTTNANHACDFDECTLQHFLLMIN